MRKMHVHPVFRGVFAIVFKLRHLRRQVDGEIKSDSAHPDRASEITLIRIVCYIRTAYCDLIRFSCGAYIRSRRFSDRECMKISGRSALEILFCKIENIKTHV